MAISDTQQLRIGLSWYTPLVKLICQSNAQFFTIVGDLVEDGTTETDWNDFFYNFYPALNVMPIVPVEGNHETVDNQNGPSTWMHIYFPISQSASQFYYSFNYNMVHFTIMDIELGTQEDFTSAQMAWLKTDLANAQEFPFRIVEFHVPIRDSGYYGNNLLLQSQLAPILHQYNVSLVLNGHDHHYERLLDDANMTSVVLGGGGALQDPIDVTTPFTQCIILEPTYSEISANMTALTINTYSLSQELVDHYTIFAKGSD